jgi:hypothetical protein
MQTMRAGLNRQILPWSVLDNGCENGSAYLKGLTIVD